MDLANTLSKYGKTLSKNDSGDEGPDLCLLTHSKNKIWVEAICPQKGTGEDKIPEFIEDQAMSVPSEKIILRITNAIDAKYKKHLKYKEKRICAEEEPYIIAINGCLFTPGPGLDDLTPRIVKAVSKGGRNMINFDRNSGSISERWVEYKDSLRKKNNEEISLGCFLQDKYSNISAVIYSECSYGWRPAEIGSDYILVHNPLSKNRLPEGFLKIGREYFIDTPSTINIEDIELRHNDYRCMDYLYS